jgi:uncharacterized membrane protein
MRIFLTAYATILVTLAVLDGTWLSLTINRIYRPAIGQFLSDKPIVTAAAAFYLLYAAGIAYLITLPALSGGGPGTAALRGAVLGLVAYGTYDLTSLSVMRGWPLQMSLIDMGWGMVLTATAAALSTLVTARFG